MAKNPSRKERHYTVVFEREHDGGYHACCPALPGCHAQGDTLDEADANIRDALRLYLRSLRAHGERLPDEDILIRPVRIAL